jgi:hypothetical protein
MYKETSRLLIHQRILTAEALYIASSATLAKSHVALVHVVAIAKCPSVDFPHFIFGQFLLTKDRIKTRNLICLFHKIMPQFLPKRGRNGLMVIFD